MNTRKAQDEKKPDDQRESAGVNCSLRRFEYKTTDCERDVLSAVLEGHANDGWKMVTAIFTGEHTNSISGHIYRMFTVIFEREKQ